MTTLERPMSPAKREAAPYTHIRVLATSRDTLRDESDRRGVSIASLVSGLIEMSGSGFVSALNEIADSHSITPECVATAIFGSWDTLPISEKMKLLGLAPADAAPARELMASGIPAGSRARQIGLE